MILKMMFLLLDNMVVPYQVFRVFACKFIPACDFKVGIKQDDVKFRRNSTPEQETASTKRGKTRPQ